MFIIIISVLRSVENVKFKVGLLIQKIDNNS